MESTDITIEILGDIRDAVREVSGRVDQTNARLDKTNTRLEQTNERMEEVRNELAGRIAQSEMRTATAIVEVAGTLRDIRSLLEDRLQVRDRVDRCERDIEVIKTRLSM